MKTIKSIDLKGIGQKEKKIKCFGCHDLDPLTLILKPDLDIVVTYLHTKYEVNRSICSKVMV